MNDHQKRAKEWAERSSSEIVGRIETEGSTLFVQAAHAEMQRRMITAVNDATTAANTQAGKTARLNSHMLRLTWATALLAVVQALTALWPWIRTWGT